MDAVRELGALLASAGYDEAGLRRATGGLDAWQARALRRHGLLDGGRLAGLVDLFHHGLPVDRALLAPLEPEALAELVAAEDGLVRARAQITPWHGLLVAHDPDDAVPGPGHVPGANTSGDALARATVRLPVERALDLGCGSGIHALLAAGHAKHVTAVDVNPDALRYTALNARLNGLETVETREGSWLEPVAGERFDLVVCNPPYVLSPDRDYLFRDGGEGLARRLVRELPGHLTEGGFGHVLCNWATGPGESPWAVLEEWTAGTGCDVLAIALGSEGVLPYAARWAAPLGGTRDETAYAERVGRWLEHHRSAGSETIWLGLVLLRRRSGASWFRGVGAPGPVAGSASAQLLRIVAAQDWLAAGAGPCRVRLAPGATLVRETSAEGARASVSLDEGLGVHGSIDPDLGPLLDTPLDRLPPGLVQLLELGLVERC